MSLHDSSVVKLSNIACETTKINFSLTRENDSPELGALDFLIYNLSEFLTLYYIKKFGDNFRWNGSGPGTLLSRAISVSLITIGIPFLQSNIFDSDVRGWRQPNYEYSLFYSKVHLTAVQLPFYPSLAWQTE